MAILLPSPLMFIGKPLLSISSRHGIVVEYDVMKSLVDCRTMPCFTAYISRSSSLRADLLALLFVN